MTFSGCDAILGSRDVSASGLAPDGALGVLGRWVFLAIATAAHAERVDTWKETGHNRRTGGERSRLFSGARLLARPLSSSLPMYLLYVDESGPDDRDHFVVAGFAVHEQDAAPMAFALDDQGRESAAGPGAWR